MTSNKNIHISGRLAELKQRLIKEVKMSTQKVVHCTSSLIKEIRKNMAIPCNQITKYLLMFAYFCD